MRTGITRYLTSAFVILTAVSSAHALIVGADGRITDWGIAPFSDWGPPINTVGDGGTNNNWSPVNYPNGVGHRPSPGGATGELFDLEALYARRNGSDFQVLLVTSMGLYTTITSGGYQYHLGDLFLDFGQDDAYDLVLITQDSRNHGFVGGELRKVSQVHNVIPDHSSYGGNAAVADLVNPFALSSGALLATGTLNSAFYANYAGGTEPSWIYEWTIPFSSLNVPQGQTLGLHMTVECGNDLIELGVAPLSQPPPIPEPTSLVLAGSALVALVRRMRGRMA